MNIESCYIMLKPGFADNYQIVKKVRTEIEKLNLCIRHQGYKKYTADEAKYHYIEKKEKPFYNELVLYLTSNEVYGFVVTGQDAIDKCRGLAERLRRELPKQFDLKTDVMKNVIHCTSKTTVDGQRLDLDSDREIKLFCHNSI